MSGAKRASRMLDSAANAPTPRKRASRSPSSGRSQPSTPSPRAATARRHCETRARSEPPPVPTLDPIMSAFTASAVAAPGAAKVLSARRATATRVAMAPKRVAARAVRAPVSVSAKAGPSGEVKKVRIHPEPTHRGHHPSPIAGGWSWRSLSPSLARYPNPSQKQKHPNPNPLLSPLAQVVLAYSGGLDTSIILKWLQDTYGCEVVTFTADLGQGEGASSLTRARSDPNVSSLRATRRARRSERRFSNPRGRVRPRLTDTPIPHSLVVSIVSQSSSPPVPRLSRWA